MLVRGVQTGPGQAGLRVVGVGSCAPVWTLSFQVTGLLAHTSLSCKQARASEPAETRLQRHPQTGPPVPTLGSTPFPGPSSGQTGHAAHPLGHACSHPPGGTMDLGLLGHRHCEPMDGRPWCSIRRRWGPARGAEGERGRTGPPIALPHHHLSAIREVSLPGHLFSFLESVRFPS